MKQLLITRKHQKSVPGKRPSKRPGQPGEFIGVRLQPEPLAKLDAWRRHQPDVPTRPEAIRRLIEQAIEKKGKFK